MPISMTPSATGRVLSKTVALVKLRMEKLSSHFSGQGRRRPLFVLHANPAGKHRGNLITEFHHRPRGDSRLRLSRSAQLDRGPSPAYASAAYLEALWVAV